MGRTAHAKAAYLFIISFFLTLACSALEAEAIAFDSPRWTGVLEKRDGKWLIVQMHFSFASDMVAAEVKAKLAKDASPLPPDKE